MFTGLNLNNGQYLQFGDLCQWDDPDTDGFNPVTTRKPSSININSYKSQVLSKSTEVDTIMGQVRGTAYTYESYGELLTQIKETMENQAVWLWGNFNDGGAFLYNTGSSTGCGFSVWTYYKKEIAEDEYRYYINNANIIVSFQETNAVLGTGDTRLFFFNIWSRTSGVGDLIPPIADAYSYYYYCTAFPAMYYDNKDELSSEIDPITGLPVPEWRQTQIWRYMTWTDYIANYLNNYTDIVEVQGNNLDDHPWLRYVQNRTFITGVCRLEMSETLDNVERIGAFFGGSAVDESGNPYGGETSGEGGGDGTGSDYSEDVDDGGLPSSSLLTTGMASIYLPTSQNMSDFADFLFNDITSNIEAKLKKLFANPIESILSLSLCHLKIPYTGSNTINFAGISSGVTSPTANAVFYQLDYKVNLKEYWGSALDYSSYTKIKIYIPYCGIYDLNIDDVQDSTITLTYKIDILSGMCIAIVKSTHNNKAGSFDSYIYQFNGNIFLNVPITSTDWSSMFNSVLNMASVAIAPSPVSAVGMAETVMSQKVNVQKSGQIGSNYGYLGIQDPYIIIERPTQSIPVNFGDYYGYPSNIYGAISSFKGYIEVDPTTVWSNKVPCTDTEAEEIKTLFEGGVYL